MRAAILSHSLYDINRVYGSKQIKAIQEIVDLKPDYCLRYEDLPEDVEVIFSTWGMLTPTEEEIKKYTPKLKVVFYAAGTVQYFARPFLNLGIRVFSAWQANAVPVAYYTFSQIFLALKGYFPMQLLQRNESREAACGIFRNFPGGFEAKVGLLGAGAIGARVAELLRPMGLEVMVFDPFLSDERAAALGVTKASMDEIFSSCFVVSNHLANLPETQKIIKREHLMSMLPYSTFINTGRGAQLDEQDLYDALVADPSRTALLDVLEDEENCDARPISKLSNAHLTPHIAGASGFEVHRMAEYMTDCCRAFLRADASIPYEVTMKMLETMA